MADKEILSYLFFRFPKQDVLALEWSPDGSMLLAGCIDHKLSIWDAGKGTCLFSKFILSFIVRVVF